MKRKIQNQRLIQSYNKIENKTMLTAVILSVLYLSFLAGLTALQQFAKTSVSPPARTIN